MSKNKTQKFAENDKRRNVIQAGKPLFEKIKGNWRREYFQNENDLVLELACGRGEYTVGLARQFPDRNFVGVDIKGARIWKGSGQAISEGLMNAAFLRTQIQSLHEFFEPKEVDEIWIVHPDPRPKKSDIHRRLTHPRFLEMYKSLIKKDGWIKLKTDNTALFEYSVEVLESRSDIQDLQYTFDLYESELLAEHYEITTRYELEFSGEGEKIKYLKFKFSKTG